MKFTNAWLWVVALGVLAGCQGNKSSGYISNNDKPKTTSTTTGGSTGSETTPNATTGGAEPNTQPGSSGSPNTPEGTKPDPTVSPNGNKVPALPTVTENFKEPGKPEPGVWNKDAMKASELAKKMSDSMSKLSRTVVESKYDVKTPEGVGTYNLLAQLGEPGHYKIQMLTSEKIPNTGQIVSNGVRKFRMSMGGKGQLKPANVPFEDAKLNPKETAVDFSKRASRMIYAGITDGSHPWAQLFSAVGDPKSGYETTVERRVTEYRGQNVASYRVVAKRKPEIAKSLGVSQIEIVIDGTRWLPVTIRAYNVDAKGGEWRTDWTAMYKFNQEIPADTFNVGKA